MVTSKEHLPKGTTLMASTVRPLASTSGIRVSSTMRLMNSSPISTWDFFTKIMDSTNVLLAFSCSSFTLSWSCFTYLIASPSTVALSP
ncbi:unnamed protein product [Linum trigynum]|uniref:Uncharacterized protein n=1 Tax=Linum trigynum TaxID=586398 RepID=A0AAV2EZP4_9ROSI